MSTQMRILTFDIEEWFHLLDFADTKTQCQWEGFEVRIHENVDRILSILEEKNAKATFFIIGWIAKKYPEVVKKIASRYQIGCHTMNHQLVWQQTPQEFENDVESCLKLLEDITGKKVECFRAPGFSIRESETWAFEVLAKLGITTDCSIFAGRHAHGGMPSFPCQGPAIISCGGITLKEFPINYRRMLGHNIIFSGGGYFRLFPYWLINKWTKESDDYLLSYIHPRDLDANQPVLKNLSLPRRFKSYVGIRHAEKKLRQWLQDYSFTDIRSASEAIDWNNSIKVEL